MARIFAFIGNRPDLGAQLLASQPEVLQVRRHDQPLGWGLGFFQSGEMLLRRRPTDDREVVDLTEAVLAVRTTALLGHVRMPTTGDLRTENTQPFRYGPYRSGGWLFGSSGTLPDYEHLRPRLLGALPAFLQQNVRGETDSELIFYTFLSFLHDAGALRENSVTPGQIRDALRSALALIDRLSAEQGQSRSEGTLMVTNGEHLAVAHRSGPLGIRTYRGRADLEAALGAEATNVPNLESSRFTLLVAGLEELPPGWERLPDGICVTAEPTGAPESEAL
jgi:glutamine amidotransferase